MVETVPIDSNDNDKLRPDVDATCQEGAPLAVGILSANFAPD